MDSSGEDGVGEEEVLALEPEIISSVSVTTRPLLVSSLLRVTRL